MSDFEILEHMKDNYVNMLFKEDKNKEKFLNFLLQLGELYDSSHAKKFMNNRHISFYYSDFTLNNSCLSGSSSLEGFEDCYYEDLFNDYTVDLI